MGGNERIVLKMEIKSCRDCIHSSNNYIEHDDPFTSMPSKIYWFCNQGKNTKRNVNITNPDEISKDCPLR